MISGIDLKAVVRFSLKDDKENPTIWLLGALNSCDLARVAVIASTNQMKAMLEIVRLGLRGWENFKLNDKEVEFKTTGDVLDISLLNILPINVITEIGTELLTINKLTSSESKN